MLRFHFDYLSPYAYLAWTQIHALAQRHGRTVEPVPTLFAALLAHGGTKGPAEIPAKRIYVFKDALRTARLLGVPLQLPVLCADGSSVVCDVLIEQRALVTGRHLYVASIEPVA